MPVVVKDGMIRAALVHYQRRQWHPTPVLLPGKSHGWRSLVGYSPWGCKESDTTKRLHFHTSQTECGPSQKARVAPGDGVVSFDRGG